MSSGTKACGKNIPKIDTGIKLKLSVHGFHMVMSATIRQIFFEGNVCEASTENSVTMATR